MWPSQKISLASRSRASLVVCGKSGRGAVRVVVSPSFIGKRTFATSERGLLRRKLRQSLRALRPANAASNVGLLGPAKRRF